MKTSSRIFWGLILIASALYLVLSQLGLLNISLSIGTVVMGVLCLAILVSSLANRSFGGFFFSLGLAWICFGELLHLPSVSCWIVLVIVILFTIGFNILFPKKKQPRKENLKNDNNMKQYHTVVEEVDDNHMIYENSFGALAKYINTQDFKGAEAKNSFGELKLFFDNANIVSGPVEIRVNNSFGSTQLFFPSDWNVVHSVNVFAGEVKEINRANAGNGPTVKLVGSSNFGEIRITYI